MSLPNAIGAAARTALDDGEPALLGAHTAGVAGVGGAFRALRRRAVHAMITTSSSSNSPTSNGTHA